MEQTEAQQGEVYQGQFGERNATSGSSRSPDKASNLDLTTTKDQVFCCVVATPIHYLSNLTVNMQSGILYRLRAVNLDSKDRGSIRTIQ